MQYVTAVAADIALGPALKQLERETRHSGGGLFKLSAKSNLTEVPLPPMEADDDLLPLYHFPCCNESIKADRHNRLFCIICGKEMDVTMSEAQSIFLSHKGVDKKLVSDFKETLAAIGYDPWLDEDKMPAGTNIERGILEGMNSSCAAMFFITPSFEDENYLETEVTYATQQKREKGDKFAIIILQFVDEEGNTGEIPKLLRTYVWKQPKSHLEAFREILRALPIQTGEVKWREGIEGVLNIPQLKSKTAELSDEAKAILKEASCSDGKIIVTDSFDGRSITAGGKSMIPDRDARTEALWLGGLEDLERRRFIEPLNHKREIFGVTREGYAAADELPNPSDE